MIIESIKLNLPLRIQHLRGVIEQKYFFCFLWKPQAHAPVNNCPDAIKVRGIKPNQELKSIILKLRSGLFVFHLRRNEEICEKKVNAIHKKYVGNKTKIRLARKEELSAFKVEKGTVNPLLVELWPLNHVVSPSLLEEKVVYTNDGELDGYVRFDPRLILESKNHIVDHFIV